MIQSVTVTNHLGESLTMVLTDPDASGFYIKSINGLGPPKADIIFTEISTDDGGIDNSARVQTRSITMSLGFLPKNTIEETRHLTYKYFPLKKHITLTVKTDVRTCWIDGIVSGNEPSIFSDKEGCQITIQCGDPFFRSDQNNETVFFGTISEFEFPFRNEIGLEWVGKSVDDSNDEEILGYYIDREGNEIPDATIAGSVAENHENEPSLIFGYIENHTEGVVYYDGDEDTGVTINLHAIAPATGIAIYNITARTVMRIDDAKLELMTGEGIHAGDEIIISTAKGKKGIILRRDGVDRNILNVLGRPIEWFTLTKGDNIFAYTAQTGRENLQFRITNEILYEGV